MSGRCIHVFCTNSKQTRNLVWQKKQARIWVVMRQYLNFHSAFWRGWRTVAHKIESEMQGGSSMGCRKADDTVFYLLVLCAFKNLICVCPFLGQIRKEIRYCTSGYWDNLFLPLFVNVIFSHALMPYLIANRRGTGHLSHSWISIHSSFVLSLPWKLQVYLALSLTLALSSHNPLLLVVLVQPK